MPDCLPQLVIMLDCLQLTEKLSDCDLLTLSKDTFKHSKYLVCEMIIGQKANQIYCI